MPILPKRVVRELQRYNAPNEGRLQYVRLDFNENTSGFPSAYPADIPHLQISAYPEYTELTALLSEFYDLPAESILLTNGSDEGLMVAAMTFIEPGEDYAIVSDPCFTMIPHGLKLAGASLRVVPVLSDLSFDVAGIEKALKQGAKVAMFATPENPTGAVLDCDIIRKWCAQFTDTLFVIDEAYGEYSDRTMLPDVSNYDNLLVVKTFSKAWGMAGLRLGVTFGQPELIDYMLRVRLPYSVNSAAVWTAARLLKQANEVRKLASETIDEKARMVGELRRRGIPVDDGKANSVLVGVGINAQRLSDFCKRQGVLVRNRSQAQFPSDLNGSRPPLWGKVRVSVGTREETDKFLAAVDKFNDTYGVIFDLDGTLIDTTASFDSTVKSLVERYSGRPLDPSELQALRAEGGFNDDWVATSELLKRRGNPVAMQTIVAEATQLYLSVARQAEKLLFEQELIERLRRRHPLFVVTGRTRGEYNPVWADDLDGHFHRVYCLDDIAGKRAKPSPDYLLHVIEEFGLNGGAYVGNAVDDMQAARAAGLDAIGVTTTHTADVLREAGAHITIPSVASLIEVFMV
jgi:histidinol-phosphate aminotransferase